MRIVIELRTDNAAFEDNPDEFQRILIDLVCHWDNADPRDRSLLDYNGNRVGTVTVTERDGGE